MLPQANATIMYVHVWLQHCQPVGRVLVKKVDIWLCFSSCLFLFWAMSVPQGKGEPVLPPLLFLILCVVPQWSKWTDKGSDLEEQLAKPASCLSSLTLLPSRIKWGEKQICRLKHFSYFSWTAGGFVGDEEGRNCSSGSLTVYSLPLTCAPYQVCISQQELEFLTCLAFFFSQPWHAFSNSRSHRQWKKMAWLGLSAGSKACLPLSSRGRRIM